MKFLTFSMQQTQLVGLFLRHSAQGVLHAVHGRRQVGRAAHTILQLRVSERAAGAVCGLLLVHAHHQPLQVALLRPALRLSGQVRVWSRPLAQSNNICSTLLLIIIFFKYCC